MTPTTSIRRATKQRLRDLLAGNGDLADAQVSYSAPREYTNRSVWLGAITGTQDTPRMTSGRKVRDDDYDIEVFCAAMDPGASDGEYADEVVEALFAVVENTIADSPLLLLDGVNLAGLNWAVLGEVDGPDSFPISNPDGYGSIIRAVVSCNARLS